jgi:hypothetical protein
LLVEIFVDLLPKVKKDETCLDKQIRKPFESTKLEGAVGLLRVLFQFP